MKLYKIKAFTLVELIVVITVLAVLSTIGFVSYSSYLTGVRDTNRISNLKAISDGLEMYRTKNNLPLPEDSVEVQVNGNVIAWQGYIGKNVLQTIEFSNGGMDPKDKTYFSYYLTKDRKYFQLMAFLEETVNLQTTAGVFDKANAVDYSFRHPTVYGKKLGILTDTSNTPIQEISSIVTAGELELSTLTTEYIARFSDNDSLTGTGDLLSINTNASCKRIKELKGGSQDGVYNIDPAGDGTGFSAYCDMTTDGGGWTMVARSVSGGTGNFGWNTSFGTPTIDTNYYSMGDDSDNIKFSEIMIASYTNLKIIDGAVVFTVPTPSLIAGTSSTIEATSNVTQVLGEGYTDEFNYWGDINELDQYFFDSVGTVNNEGLLVNGIETGASGLFDGKQGMLFIR